MTYSVIHIDGSKRGRYCGEFSPDEIAMGMQIENQVYNVSYQAAKAIGLEWHGGYAIYSDAKSRLVEFKLLR